MGTTDEYERDFSKPPNLINKGRIHPKLFDNVDDAGDGKPGLQKAFRNYIEDIHSAEANAHIDDITDIPSRDHNDLLNIGANDHIDDITDITTRNHNDLQNIDAGDINHLTDAQVAALHATYTDAEARAAINDIFGADGKADKTIDMDGQDMDNIKNIDENVWFVSTPAELQTAIDTIGANAGLIILQSGTFNLAGTPIDIDQGGSYVIQGQGNATIIDCGGDNKAFNISSCTSCILRDFKIDANDLTTTSTEVITVNESSDNPVVFDNVFITGDGSNGIAIRLSSDNCNITNCRIDSLDQGILVWGGNETIIANNKIESDNGIYLYDSHRNIIIGNYVYDCSARGILLGGGTNSGYNTVVGNSCYNNATGIYINSADNNNINGNTCFSGTTGIELTSEADNNTVMGNTCLNNGTNYINNGSNTFDTDGSAQALNNIA